MYSSRSSARGAHPGIMRLCVDQDPLSLSCPGFCHSLRYSTRPPALEAGYLNKHPHGLCVKNSLPLALFTVLRAGSSVVCQQLQMEPCSAAVGWLGTAGSRRPCTASSVQVGGAACPLVAEDSLHDARVVVSLRVQNMFLCIILGILQLILCLCPLETNV